MSNRLYPCSVNDPLGEGTHSGLLGHGTLPWPSVIAERHFPTSMSISGFYATDELSAAHFMVATLSDPDNGLDAQEHEQMALHLSYLLSKVKVAGYVTAREVKELHQKAQSIPVIGPALFSLSSLPSTTAALAGLIHAPFKAGRLVDMLDLSPELKRQLVNWANTRGKPGSVSAKRAFKQRIKLVRIQGQLHFEVPANARAQFYTIGGKTASNAIKLPIYQAAEALRRRVPITPSAYSARGIGRILTGTTAGALLTVGPQAIIDGTSSNGFNDFLNKSAYSQSTNVGIIILSSVVGLAGLSAMATIAIVIAGGIIIHALMNMGEYSANERIGDALTGTTR